MRIIAVKKMDWGTPRQVRSQIGIILAVAGVWGILLLVLALGQGCSSPTVAPQTPSAQVTWDNAIGPLLGRHCVVCHGGASNLNLDTYENALKGGKRGPTILPGNSAGSLLVRAVRGSEPGLTRMPPNRPPLSEEQIEMIVAWIDAGAPR